MKTLLLLLAFAVSPLMALENAQSAKPVVVSITPTTEAEAPVTTHRKNEEEYPRTLWEYTGRKFKIDTKKRKLRLTAVFIARTVDKNTKKEHFMMDGGAGQPLDDNDTDGIVEFTISDLFVKSRTDFLAAPHIQSDSKPPTDGSNPFKGEGSFGVTYAGWAVQITSDKGDLVDIVTSDPKFDKMAKEHFRDERKAAADMNR